MPLNVLPEPIAARLKRGEEPIADHYDDITVLFADLAGFTVRSAHESPAETVAALNEVFSVFDGLVRRHGLEKIRTIGDSYMVAAGAPVVRPDHVHAICAMALDLKREVARLNADHDWDLSFRIGINSGPAVAGIVGREKLHHDLWGDTVNAASRMESHGLPDQIQVTEAVYERLKNDFVFERRGLVDVKGKGPTVTYLLVGRMGEHSESGPLTAQTPSPSVGPERIQAILQPAIRSTSRSRQPHRTKWRTKSPYGRGRGNRRPHHPRYPPRQPQERHGDQRQDSPDQHRDC